MTFAIRPGQVTGFVRPNGARRSATKRVILGLDAADVGSALLDGMPHATAASAEPVGDVVRDRAAARSPRPQPLAVAGPPARHDVRRVDEVIAQAGLEKVPAEGLGRCGASRRRVASGQTPFHRTVKERMDKAS